MLLQRFGCPEFRRVVRCREGDPPVSGKTTVQIIPSEIPFERQKRAPKRGQEPFSQRLDALGNMPSVNTDGTAVSRTHDDGNEITQIGSTSVTYTYSNLSNDGTQSYFYDVNNHLTTVKNAAGTSTIATYTYDALGRRITESPNGGTTTDVYYSANWQALEDDQSGHAKSQYVWSPVYIDAMVLRDRDADSDGSH
jgi:YD repeat-containing protein